MSYTNRTSLIIDYFKTIDNNKKANNTYIYKTEKGIFGVSDLEKVQKFFEKINLTHTDAFLDLGSGDGRVTILASNYCNAYGVEFEKVLVNESETHARQLNSKSNFKCNDFNNLDFSKYNVIFSFSDQFFSKQLIIKMKKEFTGILYIYEGIFLPDRVKKGKTIWVDQTPIISYEFNKKNN